MSVLPQAHCEVKRHKKIAAIAFLEQAERDAAPGELPFVLMRKDGDTEWVLMLRVSDAVGLAERVASNLGAPVHPLDAEPAPV